MAAVNEIKDPPPFVQLTTAEFALFQELVARETGIHLSDAKRSLLVNRLGTRLRALGLSSFAQYHRYLTEADENAEELTQMVNRVCTNETEFFRQPTHFDLLKDRILPSWVSAAAAGRRSRTVRAWSAACSTGEEPYSIAMTLLHHLPADDGWKIDVLGTDISTRVLEQARSAAWPLAKAELIPDVYRRRFMLRGVRSREGLMRVGPAVRSVVQLRRLNLIDARYDVSGPFDLIFCRNVCIYFASETKKRVIERMIDLLTPTGTLFLGHAESLIGITDRVQIVMPTVYVPILSMRAREAQT